MRGDVASAADRWYGSYDDDVPVVRDSAQEVNSRNSGWRFPLPLSAEAAPRVDVLSALFHSSLSNPAPLT